MPYLQTWILPSHLNQFDGHLVFMASVGAYNPTKWHMHRKTVLQREVKCDCVSQPVRSMWYSRLRLPRGLFPAVDRYTVHDVSVLQKAKTRQTFKFLFIIYYYFNLILSSSRICIQFVFMHKYEHYICLCIFSVNILAICMLCFKNCISNYCASIIFGSARPTVGKFLRH